MVVSITRDGMTRYFHTAWADDARGTNFSLTEYDDANYIGTFTDSSSAESSVYTRYNWKILASEDEPAEDEALASDAYDDLETRIAELEDNEALVMAKENAGNIQSTVRAMDEGLGNVNLLYGTNKGVSGWTGSSGLTLEAVTGTIYSDLEDAISYLKVTAASAGGYLFFDASYLADTLGSEDVDGENTYTFSADVRLSDVFAIPVDVQNQDGTSQQIDFGEIDIETENEEIDTTDTWMYQVLTAQSLGVAADAQVLYFDLTDMPAGSTLEIANLKVEYGAAATEWRMSQEEIAATASEALAKATEQSNYFWHTGTGDDVGAHITEIPREDFIADPTNGGGNLLARANGIAVRDGLTEVAKLSAEGAQIGADAEPNVLIDNTGIRLVGGDGREVLSFKASEGRLPIFCTDKVKGSYLYAYNHGAPEEVVHSMTRPVVGSTITVLLYMSSNGSYSSVTKTYTAGTSRTDMLNGWYSASYSVRYDADDEAIVLRRRTDSTLPAERAVRYGYDLYSVKYYSDPDAPYFSIGERNDDPGGYSAIIGRSLIAKYDDQIVVGKFNYNNATTVFEVGNGADDSSRSNALTVDWSGNVVAAGDVTNGSGKSLSDMPVVLFDTTAGWQTAGQAISAENTIYVWTDYQQDEDGNDVAGFKVGDGLAYIIDLPFVDAPMQEHMSDQVVHITQTEREFWNNKERAYVVGESLILTKQ